jgi:hypothetical protein
VQTVLVQDEALKQAHHRIEELEAAGAPEPQPQGGFLDSMRDAIFGQNQPHCSVPNVPAPGAGSRDTGSRPVWNSGQVLPGSMQQAQSPWRYDQGSYGQGSYGQGSYGQQPYGAPQGQMGGPMGGAMGGGGSFLGTAAAAAAGMVGGSLLLNSFRGMMGGGSSRSAFGDTATQNPWSDQSRSGLARDAGVNDVGSQQDLARQDREQDAEQDRDDASSRDGFFNSASNDDDTDHDSDGFDGDGDSDNA